MNTRGLKQKNKYYDVYLLVCPKDKIVRYVGITSHGRMTKRLKEHLSSNQKDINPYKYNWLQKLKRLDYPPPKVEFFARKTSLKKAVFLEKKLIKMFRVLHGKKLTNISEGGNIPTSQKKSVQALNGKKVVRVFSSIREAAREVGVNEKNIRRCLKKERSTAGGFSWESVDAQ